MFAICDNKNATETILVLSRRMEKGRKEEGGMEGGNKKAPGWGLQFGVIL